MHRHRRTEDQEEDRLMNGESRLIMEGLEDMHRPRRHHQTEEHRPAARGITKGEM